MSSIFTSRVQRTIPIPFDPPHEVTIRKLSGRQLQRAREASLAASADALRRMGGVAFQKELASLGDAIQQAEAVARAQADPMTSYDRATVLVEGIVGWTYEEPKTADAVDDLSEEAAEFIARAILELTLPPPGDRKNS